MGRSPSMRTFRVSRRRRRLPALSASLRTVRPRDYVEWSTLRRWNRLPDWELAPTGYLLREAREAAGLTQAELGIRLEISQQAVARAERWDANPTVAFLRRWGEACGRDLVVELRPSDPRPRATAR